MAAATVRALLLSKTSIGLGYSDPIRQGVRFSDNAKSSPKYLAKTNKGWARRAEKKWCLFCAYNVLDRAQDGLELLNSEDPSSSTILSSLLVNSEEDAIINSEQKVYDVILKQASLVGKMRSCSLLDVKPELAVPGTDIILKEAYNRCREVCAEYAKTFYLGTMLMTPGRRRAIWAIYVWCRRTDELVDGPNALHITPSALNRWETRLQDLFAGHPYDMFDAALSDTVSKFPVDIQPFLDMIKGMRMDLGKSRYKNFDELYLYCYYVAGTVGLVSVPVMGIAPESKASTASVYSAALALGIANQLTNILRDVGEDASRGRIYLPQDELAQAGLSDEDVFKGKVTDKWRSFMRSQIERARMFFDEAEKGIPELSQASRWPVLSSLLLYRKILEEIEANDYNNFTKRAYVSKAKKLMSLPAAYVRSLSSSKIKQC